MPSALRLAPSCALQKDRGVSGSELDPTLQDHLFRHPDRVLTLFRTYTKQEGEQVGGRRGTQCVPPARVFVHVNVPLCVHMWTHVSWRAHALALCVQVPSPSYTPLVA